MIQKMHCAMFRKFLNGTVIFKRNKNQSKRIKVRKGGLDYFVEPTVKHGYPASDSFS